MPATALAPAWIARFVSLLGGLLALLCTWWLARLFFPQQVWLAAAAAAVAAFNPQFLYTAVSMTNDAWAAGGAALALAAAAHAALRADAPRGWLWVGLALGLAALTKYSTLLVAAPVGLLWLDYWRRQGWRPALRGALWASGGFLALAGWWFVRNLLLYGEIVPFARMAEVLPTMRRALPYDLPTTLGYAPWLVASFWGVFVAVIAPGWYLDLTRWFMLLGFGGLFPELRLLRARCAPNLRLVYLVLLPWLAIVAASVLYWTSTVDYGEQGRLAHIGASAFGVTMAAGWAGWAPQRWQTALHGLLVVFMLALAVTGFGVLRTAFALPPALPQPFALERPLAAHFAGGMRVVGVALPEGAALAPGDALPVTIYFTADAPIDRGVHALPAPGRCAGRAALSVRRRRRARRPPHAPVAAGGGLCRRSTRSRCRRRVRQGWPRSPPASTRGVRSARGSRSSRPTASRWATG
jgi:4-amino-4-deoxy-L-arabinose transferase-like glycosyltransferase